MKSTLNNGRTVCRDIEMQLEDAANAVPGAGEFSVLMASMPGALREHAAACADCRSTVKNLLESRALMGELTSCAAMGGPWFAPRVMAAIAARKAELARVPDTLAFFPKLAARLAWASAIALLLASGWLYQKPAANTFATKSVVTDITGDPVVYNVTPANNDEVLVSLSEQPR